MLTLNARIYRWAKKFVLALSRMLPLPLISEEHSDKSGHTGRTTGPAKLSRTLVFIDFFMIRVKNDYDYTKIKTLIYGDGKEIVAPPEFFIHIRCGDYKTFNLNGRRLDFRYYYKYYLNAIEYVARNYPQIKTITIFSDEVEHLLVNRIAERIQRRGFEVHKSRRTNQDDWLAMGNSLYGGICSASTFSLSAALLLSRQSIRIIPYNWLNFIKGQCFPSSLQSNQFIKVKNLWIIP